MERTCTRSGAPPFAGCPVQASFAWAGIFVCGGEHRWRMAIRSHQLDPQVSPNGVRGPAQRLQRDRSIAGIEQAIQGRATGVHASRHLHLADFVLSHRLLHLPCDRFFQRGGTRLFQNAFLAQEVVQRRANVGIFLFHAVLARFIREGAQDGLWGDQITPNIMAWG